MKIALAASWSRQQEIKKVAKELRAMDLEVVSRWLDEEVRTPRAWTHEKYLEEMAYRDLDDVGECNIFVRFSDDLSAPLVPSHLATGGHMFETGVAYALGKRIVIVGKKQNLYDRLGVTIVPDVEALKRLLSRVEVN